MSRALFAAIVLALVLPLAGCGSCGAASGPFPTRLRSDVFTLEMGEHRNAPLREGMQRYRIESDRRIEVVPGAGAVAKASPPAPPAPLGPTAPPARGDPPLAPVR